MNELQENLVPYTLRTGRTFEDLEVSRKMRIIVKRQPENTYQENFAYTWDEQGLSELFSECYVDSTRYCGEAKSWYIYKEGVWQKDVGGLTTAERIKEFYLIMIQYCAEIKDEEKQTAYLKFITKLGDRRVRDRLMKDAASVNPIPAAVFDSKPYLINCRNGTYDLRKMEFREHRWEDYLTMRTAFSYTPKEHQRYERWDQFIDEICSGDKHKAEYLQRALGYSMLGTSKEECMFILHGKTTRNGKSTLLGTIQHLLGDYATVSPVSIICKSDRSKNAEAASPTIAGLKGKRFVTMAESNQYGRLDEEAIKQLTGGEEISARNLYESQMTYLPQFTLWLSCNDLPAVHDKSLFASDRVRVIEFNRHFSESERDTSLKDEFKTPEAMSGIFVWLLRGYNRYKRDGLKMNDAMKAVIKQYEKDNDIVLQFLEDKCIYSVGQKINRKTLYDTFKVWMRSVGYNFTVSAKKFYAGLDTHPELHGGHVIIHGVDYYRDLTFKNI